ncbi:MAG TPA: 2Fe-2S iron-sulfur cluster-binding protein [Piscinibacter sp.]|jgi:ferredoxin|nr:2Fe-2S iron-sulfur cluster binding domain-containing protein [Piscinibacter sp.]HOY33692.1 2Fe-2S iron-sulfur cluster-binding protein [Piscinibacter sp.]HPG77167.1 2Fe-2S iron-sulfur cluster-binding protein [Piscinibacter sp.]HPM64745.1 2Fe-2S iron-sulfur cluster-binding protein [Piscinibacter sp.]
MSGAFTMRVEPLGHTLTVAPGQSLLEASLSAAAALPSACRNGTCRSCIARVLQGRVHHRIEWPGLSADEKAEGWVLPCVAVADSDVVLWQPLSSPPCTTSSA